MGRMCLGHSNAEVCTHKAVRIFSIGHGIKTVPGTLSSFSNNMVLLADDSSNLFIFFCLGKIYLQDEIYLCY